MACGGIRVERHFRAVSNCRAADEYAVARALTRDDRAALARAVCDRAGLLLGDNLAADEGKFVLLQQACDRPLDVVRRIVAIIERQRDLKSAAGVPLAAVAVIQVAVDQDSIVRQRIAGFQLVCSSELNVRLVRRRIVLGACLVARQHDGQLDRLALDVDGRRSELLAILIIRRNDVGSRLGRV